MSVTGGQTHDKGQTLAEYLESVAKLVRSGRESAVMLVAIIHDEDEEGHTTCYKTVAHSDGCDSFDLMNLLGHIDDMHHQARLYAHAQEMSEIDGKRKQHIQTGRPIEV